MANRYGRNQKRAHRAEIERLKQALAMTEGLLRHTSYKRAQLEEEILTSKRLLMSMGVKHSVLVPPEVIKLYGKPRRYIDVMLHPEPRHIAEFNPDEPIMPVDFHRYTLPVMIGWVDRDRIRNAVHAQVQWAENWWGYAITPEMLASMPPDIAHRELERQMVNLLMEDANKRAERGAL